MVQKEIFCFQQFNIMLCTMFDPCTNEIPDKYVISLGNKQAVQRDFIGLKKNYTAYKTLPYNVVLKFICYGE